MPKKKAAQLAREQRLAAWRQDQKAEQCNKDVPATPSIPDSLPDLQTLSITESSSTGQDQPDNISTQSNNNLPDAGKLTESNAVDPEVDPEDLPLEDPEPESAELEDELGNEDGSWVGGGDTEEVDIEEDYEKRVDNQPIPPEEQDRLVSELERIIKESFKGKGKARRSTFDEVTLGRIRLMIMSLRLSRAQDRGLVEGSRLAATAVGRGKWAAESARGWIRQFWRTNTLPAHLHGTWNESVIEDEDLKAAVLEHLRCIGRYASPKHIIEFFTTPDAEPFAHLLDQPPSLRTAQRWMHFLGYRWKTERRGQFADGHEREDVVAFRMNNYIPKILKLEARMTTWDKDGTEIPPRLAPGEKEAVVHYHDEVNYKAHDRRMTRWVHEGETAGLYKKGEGMSLMVADMVSAKYGFLRRPSDSSEGGNGDRDARVVFRPGKERDGYFNNGDVVKQLEQAMRIVNEEYPNEEHIFVFDNATTHTKLPDNAPIVSKMTLGPSHKVKGETIGPDGEKVKVDFAPGKLSDGSTQEFYYPLNHRKADLRGAFKGLAKILEERGVPGARKLRLQCPTTNGQPGCPPNRIDCCARKTMANQPDIIAQKTILQLVAESHGCSVIYLPKYHCELNPIEQCWAVSKRVYREFPMSSSEADLIKNALASLNEVKLQSIRRFAGRSQRFVYAYRDGLTGPQAAWANKRYHGHRVVTETVLQLVDNLNDS